MTFAGAVRPVGGGTQGGLVSTALTGSPCGGPKSPPCEPPVVPGLAVWARSAGGDDRHDRSRRTATRASNTERNDAFHEDSLSGVANVRMSETVRRAATAAMTCVKRTG